jgi:hypothetical protein
MSKKEFSIMPPSEIYSIVRHRNLHRHEVFYGSSNRQNSIKYGLVVFLPPELHNMSDKGVHFDKDFDSWLKRRGQAAAMSYYGWDTEQFIQVFGKNYL